MSLLEKLRLTYNFLLQKQEIDPAIAYNRIAKYYDNQPENLMLRIDDQLFRILSNNVQVEGKTVADIGCGTGKHWAFLLSKNPAALVGFDVSENMLDILRAKHFPATVYMQKNNKLQQLQNQSCDLLISTLTLGYIKNINELFAEWQRVLKPGANIIITDFHPRLLSLGGNRKFTIEGKSISAKNYIHSIKKIEKATTELGLNIIQFEEKHIDESLKPYYEEHNALHIFNKFQGEPIMYGMLLKMPDAAA